MTRLIALLRGINVGGHRVKMDDLRRLFEALRLRNVATVIASGNVLFDAATPHVPKLEQQIEAHLRRALGYAVPTLIRTLPELGAVADFPAFPPEEMADPANSLNVLFLRSAPETAVIKSVAALAGPKDAFRIEGRELYWLCHGKISIDSLAEPHLGRALKGCEGTMRNLRTIRQLVALAQPRDAAPVPPSRRSPATRVKKVV